MIDPSIPYHAPVVELLGRVEVLKRSQLVSLIVGFSYALESLCREVGLDLIDEARALRYEQTKLAAAQPTCVTDRFAFFTQTVRLPREEIETLRALIFEEERS